jgi:hypothetical protein
MKGAMKRPSSALTVAPVKKAGKVKANTSNAALQDQKGKAATKKLTQGALKAHEELLKKGAKDENEALLEFGKLDKNAQQSLWKAFELQRKSAGENEDYKHMWALEQASWQKKQTVGRLHPRQGLMWRQLQTLHAEHQGQQGGYLPESMDHSGESCPDLGKKRIAGKGSVRNNSDEEKSQRSTVS